MPAEQADGQVEAPAQAAGELFGALAGDLFESGEGDGGVDLLPAFIARQAQRAGKEGQILGHRQHRVEGVILWYQCDGARVGGTGFS